MVGEFDVSYPLQTQISDWYPPTKKPSTPAPEYYDDEEGDGGNGSSNDTAANPMIQNSPQPLPPMLPLPPTPPPLIAPSPFASLPSAENPIMDSSAPQVPGSLLGPNGVLTSDPNFNSGRHPGEIYVRKDKKSNGRQSPANRKSAEYSMTENWKNPPPWMSESELWRNTNYEWHPPKSLSPRKMNKYRWRRSAAKTKTAPTSPAQQKRRRHAKERRDLYEQLQQLPIL